MSEIEVTAGTHARPLLCFLPSNLNYLSKLPKRKRKLECPQTLSNFSVSANSLSVLHGP